MRRFARIFAAVVTCLMPAAAVAGDYPFSGAFTIAADAANPEPDGRLRCALSFFVQGKDGSFRGYHADLGYFGAAGEPRYVNYQHGQCAFDPQSRIEACDMVFDTDPGSQGRTFIDVITAQSESGVRTLAFDSREAAMDYLLMKKTEEPFPITYLACPFGAGKMEAAISEAVSTLTVDRRNELTGPDAAFLGQQIVRDLARAMGLVP